MDPAGAFRRKTKIVLSFLLAWAVLAAVHAIFYAAFRREKLLAECRQLAWRTGELPAPRGRILSPDGQVLAETRTRYDLRDRKKKTDPAMDRELRQAFPRWNGVRSGTAEQILLRDLTPEEILSLGKFLRKYPSLNVQPRTERKGAGDPKVAGWERKYETRLCGTPGRFTVMLDRRGAWIPGSMQVLKMPLPGKDVILTPEDLRK